MSNPNPTIRVAVDPTNPGQFFACCGLLELADRLWGDAEGWFDGTTTFCLRAVAPNPDATAQRLMAELVRCRLTNAMTPEEVSRLEELSNMRGRDRTKAQDEEKKRLERLWREKPLVFHDPFRLRVDWFLDDWAGGSRFKTWAGQQSVIDIGLAMKKPVEAGGWNDLPPEQWLTRTAADAGLPFNFDADLGGQASALDVGFSFDPLGLKMRTRPLIELAAFVGLQRFRPAADPKGGNRYTFELWPDRLTPEVAAVAACGALGLPNTHTYEFRLLYRTKYLKSFLPAQPIRGDR
ncbi:MAG: type I-U CRISPR-associated protein Cas8c [Gemmataceae bacterium]